MLVYLGATISPADALTRRERDMAQNLVAGAEAYEDGLYDAAQRFFEHALRRAKSPEEINEATLWLIRAMHQRDRHEEILATLDDERLAEEEDPGLEQVYRFWRARSHYARGAYDAVIAELDAVDPAVLESAEIGQRLRMIGLSYARTGRHESAVRMFESFDRDHDDAPAAAENLLDWSASMIELDRREEAESLLSRLISDFDSTRASQTGRLWLGVMLVDRGDVDEAQGILEGLLERESLPSDWAAEARYALARIKEADGDYAAALEHLQEGAEVAREAHVRNRGRLLRARVLIDRGEWDQGIELAKRIIAAMPGHELSADAQLALAGALLDQERYEEALEAYQHYLEAFEYVEGRANALMGRAWSLLGLQRPVEAASSFEKAYALHPSLMERKEALFKVADSYFQSRRYARAREEYLQVTQVFPGSELVPMAQFQAAECLARLGEMDEAVTEFRAIQDAYPGTQYAAKAVMRIGGLKEEMGEWEKAISAYNYLMREEPEGALFSDALHRRGLIRYRLGLFEEALSDFDRVVDDFPDNPFAEQAYYMRGWSLYLLGEDERALEVSETFIQRFPHSEWTPDVLFWLAAYHYNRGLFPEAETRFEEVADAYPDGPMADLALYWAGRAAMEQEEYLKAIDHFNRLTQEYPTSAKMPEVRFAQGDTLSQLGEFAGAILAFEEVIRRYPNSDLVDSAWGRKGDCQFTLGSESPDRYDEAIRSYQTVLDSATASPVMQLQAKYKIGRCYEKMGESEEALDRYLQVVYTYWHDEGAQVPEGMVWFTRAAFTAASMKEAEDDWEAATNLLQRVVDANVPASPDAERRIEKIHQDHAAAS